MGGQPPPTGGPPPTGMLRGPGMYQGGVSRKRFLTRVRMLNAECRQWHNHISRDSRECNCNPQGPGCSQSDWGQACNHQALECVWLRGCAPHRDRCEFPARPDALLTRDMQAPPGTGVGLVTPLNIDARPVTQQGVAAARVKTGQATAGPGRNECECEESTNRWLDIGRQVADKTYYLNILRTKTQDISKGVLQCMCGSL